MGFDDKRKKMAIAGLASILLVAMVVAVAVTKTGGKEGTKAAPAEVSSSTKAVKTICFPTDYKEACEKSLVNANTTDPKQLIKAAFEATLKDIEDAVKNSALFKKVAEDERTKGALVVCDKTLATSVEDLKRSFEKVADFDITKVSDYIDDVRTWLSASITNHETCLDAFANTTGDTGEKMKKLLKTSGELLSNGLAMVTEFSSILGSLELGGFTGRRLLSDDMPSFVDANARRLMTTARASLKHDLVVSKDGSGQFGTITAALHSLPKKTNQSFVIHVKEGVYKENVMIPKHVDNLILIGDGPLKTRIIGNKNSADGVDTFDSAVLIVEGEGFIARDILIENTAGPEKEQAVAVRVSGDKAIFYNVHIYGYQDTLYAHTHRQYYRDCVISGTIDFIFGNAVAVFQKCQLVVRKPLAKQKCMVTAQGRNDRKSNGITVIQNCDIVAERAFLETKPAIKAYLGRPWKEYSRTIVMESYIDGFIAPEGWSPWEGNFALDTLYYGEYKNSGAGSNMEKRVKWKGIKEITRQLATKFTSGAVFPSDGSRDEWVRASGVPYVAGLTQEK